MNERFNPSLRRESMTLSQSAELHELVQEELASILVIPKQDTEMAAAVDEAQKSLRYALLAQAIEEIVNSPSTVDLTTYRDPYDRTGFDLLAAVMQRDYIQRIQNIFKDGDNQVIDDLARMYDFRAALNSKVWDDPQMALMAGIGTFNSFMPVMMEKFNLFLDNFALSSNAKKATLDRSYASLIEIAGYDTLQLMAVLKCLDEGKFPQMSYDIKGNRMILTTSPLDLEVSDSTKQYMSRFDTVDMNAKTVADIDSSHVVIGCPVLFRPGQVKNIWQHGVNIAAALKII